PDPGTPGSPYPPFHLPFAATDVVFDPVRPYMYVSLKAGRKIYFVNRLTGFIERDFSFAHMPESLTLSPDGSRLFVALLTREHSDYWYDPHEGWIASFDLQSQQMDRVFHITEDPFDLAATTDGHLVVTSGSGQWSFIKVFDAVSGQETGAVSGTQERC